MVLVPGIEQIVNTSQFGAQRRFSIPRNGARDCANLSDHSGRMPTAADFRLSLTYKRGSAHLRAASQCTTQLFFCGGTVRLGPSFERFCVWAYNLLVSFVFSVHRFFNSSRPRAPLNMGNLFAVRCAVDKTKLMGEVSKVSCGLPERVFVYKVLDIACVCCKSSEARIGQLVHVTA